MTKRDRGAARDSYNEFAQLTSRYPNSRYAPDAKQRMIYLRNLLAAYEIHVADYYLTRQAYVAAANRGRYVVENFQETPSVGDGLAVMTEGLPASAPGRTGRHQPGNRWKLNYPNHPSLAGRSVRAVGCRSRQPFVAEQGHPGPDRIPSAAAAGKPAPTRTCRNSSRTPRTRFRNELKPKDRSGDVIEEEDHEADGNNEDRSWFSYMTFGVFD